MHRSRILAAVVLATLLGTSAGQAETVFVAGSKAAFKAQEEQSRLAVAEGQFSNSVQAQDVGRGGNQSTSYGYPLVLQRAASPVAGARAPLHRGTAEPAVPGNADVFGYAY